VACALMALAAACVAHEHVAVHVEELADLDEASNLVGESNETAADSLHEVVPAAQMHQGVKQTLVEEEKLYSIMSYNFRKGATGPYAHVDHYMRHMNRATMISTISGPMDKADSTFKVVHSLCVPGDEGCPEVNSGSTGCISLESVNFPGYFFALTENNAVKLEKADGTADFNLKASMCIQAGLADQEAVSLEFLGQSGLFLRHSGYSLFACTSEDEGECVSSSRTHEFAADATFFLKPGLFMGRCAGPDDTTKCTCFPGFLGDDCTLTCPGRGHSDAVVQVCSSHGDCTMGEDGNPECKCREGFLGKECNIVCPRDSDDNLCSGHGQCAANDKFEPVCNCEEGFMGDQCQYECPGGSANFCSGHGSCFVKEADSSIKQDERAECECSKGFKGFTCDQECPKNAQGAVCGAHGTCVLKDEKAECACFYGWRGNACSNACPRDQHGAVCSGEGVCNANSNSSDAGCTCKKGFGGKACTIMCPGARDGSVPCSGNGDCEFDEASGSASCECKNTHMGKKCQYRCPIDLHNDLPCGGDDRGTCVRDDMALPDKTRCECKEPFVGNTCHVQCPMFGGKICGGQGECFIKGSGELQLGVCKCAVGFVGEACSQECPRDDSGVACAGHGVCSLNHQKRSECSCDDGWAGNSCASRVCGTEGGLFNKETEQCTCVQGEVCCTKETQRLASMMAETLRAEKTHQQTQKKVRAQQSFIEFAEKP